MLTVQQFIQNIYILPALEQVLEMTALLFRRDKSASRHLYCICLLLYDLVQHYLMKLAFQVSS